MLAFDMRESVGGFPNNFLHCVNPEGEHIAGCYLLSFAERGLVLAGSVNHRAGMLLDWKESLIVYKEDTYLDQITRP